MHAYVCPRCTHALNQSGERHVPPVSLHLPQVRDHCHTSHFCLLRAGTQPALTSHSISKSTPNVASLPRPGSGEPSRRGMDCIRGSLGSEDALGHGQPAGLTCLESLAFVLSPTLRSPDQHPTVGLEQCYLCWLRGALLLSRPSVSSSIRV